MDANAMLLLLQATSTEASPAYRLAPAYVFLVFFVMLGPLKVIGPFAAATRDLAPAAVRALAFKVFALSVVAVVLGGLVGSALFAKWQISVPVLQLAAGLILVLVSLQMVMAQYHEAPTAAAPLAAPSAMHLVFPVSVTPYGIATLILLLALAADATRTLLVLGIALAVLVLNFLAMLAARFILHWAGLPLQILGSVLGVLQVALGLMILIDALAGVGVGVGVDVTGLARSK